MKRVAPQSIVKSNVGPAEHLRQLVVCRWDGLRLGQVHVAGHAFVTFGSDGSGWPRVCRWPCARSRAHLEGNVVLLLEAEPVREGVAVEVVHELLGVEVEVHRGFSIPRHDEVYGG